MECFNDGWGGGNAHACYLVEEESMKQYVCDKIRRDLQSFYNRKDLLLQDLREDESALLVGRQQLESFISCMRYIEHCSYFYYSLLF